MTAEGALLRIGVLGGRLPSRDQQPRKLGRPAVDRARSACGAQGRSRAPPRERRRVPSSVDPEDLSRFRRRRPSTRRPFPDKTFGDLLPSFQAPKWSASSANPPTTTSVAGLGTGSGGPAGPHSSRRCNIGARCSFGVIGCGCVAPSLLEHAVIELSDDRCCQGRPSRSWTSLLRPECSCSIDRVVRLRRPWTPGRLRARVQAVISKDSDRSKFTRAAPTRPGGMIGRIIAADHWIVKMTTVIGVAGPAGPLFGEHRVLADHQALAGIIGAGDLRHVAVIKQRGLQRPACDGELLDRRSPQRGGARSAVIQSSPAGRSVLLIGFSSFNARARTSTRNLLSVRRSSSGAVSRSSSPANRDHRNGFR